MKKYICYVVSLVAACLLAVSCGDNNNNNETITEQTLSNCFAYVSDIAEGPSAYITGKPAG